MKVWKVCSVEGDDALERQLGNLEATGATIKEVIYVTRWEYKIIYTVEDLIEEDAHGSIETVC